MPRISSNGAGNLRRTLSQRGFGEGPDSDLHDRRRFLACEVVRDDVNRRRADFRRVLNGIAIHLALCDCGSRLGRRVVSDDGNLPRQSGGSHRRQRAERGIVVDSKDALEVSMRLENVARIAAGFIARSALIHVGYDRNGGTALRNRLLESLDAILNARHLRFVDDREAAGFADCLAD